MAGAESAQGAKSLGEKLTAHKEHHQHAVATA